MSIESERRESRSCNCGCGQQFPLFSGLMGYGHLNAVAFRVAHLQHSGSGPHVWLLLGSGPWFDEDDRGCWVVLHSWLADGSLITRVEGADDSPFGKADVFEERLLTRAEVLGKKGALDWAIERSEQFAVEHQATADFILGSRAAQEALAATRETRAPEGQRGPQKG